MFKEPNRRRIYLMRHAEAAYVQDDGLPVPDSRVVPLTDIGRQQAKYQANVLREIQFDRAVCSGLPRTVQTAEAILLNRPAPALETDDQIQEIRGGDRHQPIIDLAAWLTHVANPWADADHEDARFLGGERFRDFERRVVPAFKKLVADTHWRTLLLVAHGAVNRVILNHVMALPWQGAMSIEQDPACFNIIDVDMVAAKPARYLVRAINVTGYNLTKMGVHLTDMERTAQRVAAQIKNEQNEVGG